MKLLFLAIAFVAGATSSVQVIVNAQLRTYMIHPMQATLVSFVVGTLVSSAYCLIVRSPWPSSVEIARAPWWVWCGGLLGTLFVWSSIVVSPRIGVAALLCAVVAGQMLASLLIDHFGWFHATPFPVSPQRLLGATLVVIGAVVMTTGR